MTEAQPQANSKRRLSWRRWLGVGFMVIGAAVIIYPMWPVISYEIFKPAPSFPYATRLSDSPELFHLPEIDIKADYIPTDNRLVVPKIGVDIPITEGNDETALYNGAWRIPYTSTPPEGSNTVLSAHRFQYTAGPMTFFLLPKLEPNDTFIVYWQGEEFDYVVKEKKVVHFTDAGVLKGSDTEQVTLFTCTPVYQRSSEWRLVIIADRLT
jgi:LPXTG-site transpeptidase (sortase) family protein